MNSKGVLRAIGIALAFIGGLAFLGGAGGGLTFLIGGIVLFAVNREQDDTSAKTLPPEQQELRPLSFSSNPQGRPTPLSEIPVITGRPSQPAGDPAMAYISYEMSGRDGKVDKYVSAGLILGFLGIIFMFYGAVASSGGAVFWGFLHFAPVVFCILKKHEKNGKLERAKHYSAVFTLSDCKRMPLKKIADCMHISEETVRNELPALFGDGFFVKASYAKDAVVIYDKPDDTPVSERRRVEPPVYERVMPKPPVQDDVFAAVCPYCAAPVTFVNERLHRCEYCGMSLNRTDFDAYRR